MIPRIETERLVLRGPEMADWAPTAEFLGSDRSAMIGGPMDRVRAWSSFAAQAGQWALKGWGLWTVTDRVTGQPLGRVGVYDPADWPEPELGWTLFAAAEGRGIAAEAAIAARVHAARAWGLDRIISTIRAENTRSVALARRLGAEWERDWRSPFGTLGIWRHPSVLEAAA